jgi:hypothetical protein
LTWVVVPTHDQQGRTVGAREHSDRFEKSPEFIWPSPSNEPIDVGTLLSGQPARGARPRTVHRATPPRPRGVLPPATAHWDGFLNLPATDGELMPVDVLSVDEGPTASPLTDLPLQRPPRRRTAAALAAQRLHRLAVPAPAADDDMIRRRPFGMWLVLVTAGVLLLLSVERSVRPSEPLPRPLTSETSPESPGRVDPTGSPSSTVGDTSPPTSEPAAVPGHTLEAPAPTETAQVAEAQAPEPLPDPPSLPAVRFPSPEPRAVTFPSAAEPVASAPMATSHESTPPAEEVDVAPAPAAPPPAAVDTPAPVAVAPPLAVSETPSSPSNRDLQLVASVLDRFQAAYQRLDVQAAKAIWPAVDQRALARAFGALESQVLVFERCDLSVTGPDAQANCSGRTSYVPKVGNKERRTVRVQWTFEMVKEADDWQIARAEIR